MTRNELVIAVAPEVFGPFPETQVVAFMAAGLSRTREGLATSPMIEEARAALLQVFADAAAVVQDARIQGWRQAMRACGLRAADVRSSPEQLARRLLRGDDIAAPDPVVQAYCAISAKHLAPIGAYDVGRLPDPVVTLRPARPDDVFEPLGASSDSMPLDPRVIVYAAGHEVLCWAFNHRDSARTALQPATSDALFVAEAATLAQSPAMFEAVDELQSLLAGQGSAVSEITVVSRGDPRGLLTQPTLR